MIPWWWSVIALVLGVGLSWWWAVNVFEDEAARKYHEGVEQGRHLERIGWEHDDEIVIDLAVARTQRVGRLRALLRVWHREDERHQRIVGLVRRGAGL